MATPREVRRLAFQALFQLDARNGAEADVVRESLDAVEEFTPRERDKAFAHACEAFAAREQADAEFLLIAPAWPSHRLAAADRAILRLAWHEMSSGRTQPRIVVHEAVELAKEFGTDRSPAFINGLLDKVLKRVEQAQPAAAPPASEPHDSASGPSPLAPHP